MCGFITAGIDETGYIPDGIVIPIRDIQKGILARRESIDWVVVEVRRIATAVESADAILERIVPVANLGELRAAAFGDRSLGQKSKAVIGVFRFSSHGIDGRQEIAAARIIEVGCP